MPNIDSKTPDGAPNVLKNVSACCCGDEGVSPAREEVFVVRSRRSLEKLLVPSVGGLRLEVLVSAGADVLGWGTNVLVDAVLGAAG
jgi:hypothetical protein